MSRTNKTEFSGLKEQYDVLSEHLSQNSNLALQLQGLNLQKRRLILAGAIAFFGLVQLLTNEAVTSTLAKISQVGLATFLSATVLFSYLVLKIKRKYGVQ